MSPKTKIKPYLDPLVSNVVTWFTELLILKIDRISLLCIVGVIELVLRHPDLPATTQEQARKIGKDFASRLLDDGIPLPKDVTESWIQTFGI